MKDNYDINNYEYDIDRCIGCKGCVWVDHVYMPGVRYGVKCPSSAYKLFDGYAPMGRLKIAKSLMEGTIDYTPEYLDIMYMCQQCSACDPGCKRNLDLEPFTVLESLRVKAVKDGQGPMPAHKTVAQNIADKGNRYGASEDRLGWITKDVKVSDKADMVYFPGCSSSYVEKDLAQATGKILNKAGINFMTMGDKDSCCGQPVAAVGMLDDAKKIAQTNIDNLKATGATTIVTSCAECYNTWKVVYPKMLSKNTADMGYEVVHLVELVSKLVNEGKFTLNNNMNMRVTWHDPCKLARMGEPWVEWEGTRGKYGILEPKKEYRRGTFGCYQPPRDILNNIAGLDVVEMPRMKENAFCCGAGGGVMDAYPDFAKWAAKERLTEVQSVAAEAVVSACPYCRQIFSEASKENNMNIKVYDITEIILACM